MTNGITTPAYLGGIYLVNEHKVRFVPDEDRVEHGTRRPVLVMSGPDSNSDPKWPFVLACPLSTSGKFKTRFDVALAVGQGNVTKATWVRVPAIQSLTKADLQDRWGILDERIMSQVQARLFEYLGLAD